MVNPVDRFCPPRGAHSNRCQRLALPEFAKLLDRPWRSIHCGVNVESGRRSSRAPIYSQWPRALPFWRTQGLKFDVMATSFLSRRSLKPLTNPRCLVGRNTCFSGSSEPRMAQSRTSSSRQNARSRSVPESRFSCPKGQQPKSWQSPRGSRGEPAKSHSAAPPLAPEIERRCQVRRLKDQLPHGIGDGKIAQLPGLDAHPGPAG